MAKRWIWIVCVLALSGLIFGQTTPIRSAADVVKWEAVANPEAIAPGGSGQIIATATIREGWYIYAAGGEGDWISTSVTAEGPGIESTGEVIQPKPHVKFDKGFKVDIGTFSGQVAFAAPYKLSKDTAKGTVAGVAKIMFQACENGSCLPPTPVDIPVTIQVDPAAAVFDATKLPAQPAGYVDPPAKSEEPPKAATQPVDDAQANQIRAAQQQGLLPFIGLSFGAGLLALLTPCVWPMIPITVSFFAKKSADGKSNLPGAIWYCVGIMGTFVALGLITTLAFGAGGIQLLAANPWVNLAMGVLFVVLALNLFGVFEIYVPSGLIQKAQGGTKMGGILGPVLMGLVFSLTSFTCTVPFVGTLLVTASTGGILYPLIGMTAFSAAFALPFFLLALFPGYLSKLPKSGTWLVDVKAYMGFLELAASAKFFSNFDVTMGSQPIGLLPREVFLAVWASIFAVATLFLMGWIKIGKAGATTVGWGRRIFGLANLVATVYLFAAIGGRAPLGVVTGFLPPYAVSNQVSGVTWKHTLEEATEQATSENKLLFVNFTGVTCTNCRVMEQDVFPTALVRTELEKFARAELYTDRPTEEDRKNAKLREELTQSVTNPVYVVMTTDKKVIAVHQGLASPEEFANFLKKSLEGAK